MPTEQERLQKENKLLLELMHLLESDSRPKGLAAADVLNRAKDILATLSGTRVVASREFYDKIYGFCHSVLDLSARVALEKISGSIPRGSQYILQVDKLKKSIPTSKSKIKLTSEQIDKIVLPILLEILHGVVDISNSENAKYKVGNSENTFPIHTRPRSGAFHGSENPKSVSFAPEDSVGQKKPKI